MKKVLRAAITTALKHSKIERWQLSDGFFDCPPPPLEDSQSKIRRYDNLSDPLSSPISVCRLSLRIEVLDYGLQCVCVAVEKREDATDSAIPWKVATILDHGIDTTNLWSYEGIAFVKRGVGGQPRALHTGEAS